MTEDFFKKLTESLKENKDPLDSKILEILEGAECELIEFKIGALFETKEKHYPFRVKFTTEKYLEYDSDVFDERLLEVCKEIAPITGIIIADIVVSEPSDEDSELIDSEEFIHKLIQKNCAEDFNLGNYSDAAQKAAEVFSDLLFDADVSKEECVEILTCISELIRNIEKY